MTWEQWGCVTSCLCGGTGPFLLLTGQRRGSQQPQRTTNGLFSENLRSLRCNEVQTRGRVRGRQQCKRLAWGSGAFKAAYTRRLGGDEVFALAKHFYLRWHLFRLPCVCHGVLLQHCRRGDGGYLHKVAGGTRSILPTQPASSTTGELTFEPSSNLDAALRIPRVPPKVSNCIERPRRRVLLPLPPLYWAKTEFVKSCNYL